MNYSGIRRISTHFNSLNIFLGMVQFHILVWRQAISFADKCFCHRCQFNEPFCDMKQTKQKGSLYCKFTWKQPFSLWTNQTGVKIIHETFWLGDTLEQWDWTKKHKHAAENGLKYIFRNAYSRRKYNKVSKIWMSMFEQQENSCKRNAANIWKLGPVWPGRSWNNQLQISSCSILKRCLAIKRYAHISHISEMTLQPPAVLIDTDVSKNRGIFPQNGWWWK